MTLTNDQKRFCRELLYDGDYAAAILRAGWQVSYDAAIRDGAAFLEDPEINAYIEKLLKKDARRIVLFYSRISNKKWKSLQRKKDAVERTHANLMLHRDDAVVYFVADVYRNAVKIGYTEDLSERFKTFQGANSSQLTCLFCVDGGREEEIQFHRLFAPFRLRGEWFRLSQVNNAFERFHDYCMKTGVCKKGCYHDSPDFYPGRDPWRDTAFMLEIFSKMLATESLAKTGEAA